MVAKTLTYTNISADRKEAIMEKVFSFHEINSHTYAAYCMDTGEVLYLITKTERGTWTYSGGPQSEYIKYEHARKAIVTRLTAAGYTLWIWASNI